MKLAVEGSNVIINYSRRRSAAELALMGIRIDGIATAAVETEALKLHTADKDLP